MSANATGTAALLPGCISGTWAFRKDLEAPPAISMKAIALLSALGGAIGAGLLLAGTAVVAFGGRVTQLRTGSSANHSAADYVSGRRRAWVGILAVAGYGGYFNGGRGILLLAVFGLSGETNLNAMNGLKNLVSALLTTFAVVLYAAGGRPCDHMRWP